MPGPHTAGQVLEVTHMNNTWRHQDQQWKYLQSQHNKCV
jgi:hypothetical protein